MTNTPSRNVQPAARGRSLCWVAFAALAAVVLLLWWIDPRQTAVPLCAFHEMTGLDCPGCGATRATHELLHGRLASALRHNALWVLSLPLVLYAMLSELRRAVRGRPLWGDPLRQPRLVTGLVAVALLFGVLRNVPCAPLRLLTPPPAETGHCNTAGANP